MRNYHRGNYRASSIKLAKTSLSRYKVSKKSTHRVHKRKIFEYLLDGTTG